MSPELEVCWDGVNRGDGSDLLCCAAAPSCPEAVDASTRPDRAQRTFPPDSLRKVAEAHAQACRGAILACLAHEPMTAAALQVVTGFSNKDVVAAIGYLRKADEVESDEIPPTERTKAAWKRYRRI